MKRLARILLNAATVASLALFVAAVAAWSGLARESGHTRLWRVAAGWVLQQHRFTAVVIVARPHQVSEGWRWAQADAHRWYDRQAPVGLDRVSSTPERAGAYEVVQYAAWAPPWLWALAAATLPTCRIVHRHFRHRPRGPNLCPTCGYDLRATPARCPECGTVTPP